MKDEDQKQILDYSQFFERKYSRSEQEDSSRPQVRNRKIFLKRFWEESEKKEKIEFVVLLISLIFIVVFLVKVFSGSSSVKNLPPEPNLPPVDEENIISK